MSSTEVFNAGTTLAAWAHERRRTWSDEPLPRPMPRIRVVEPTVVVPALFESAVVEPLVTEPIELESVVADLIAVEPIAVEPAIVSPEVLIAETVPFDAIELQLEDAASMSQATDEPSRSAFDVVFSVMRGAGAVAMASLESLQFHSDSAADWLMRGAALLSLLSVMLFVGINRGGVFDRYNRVTSVVKAATARPAAPLPPPGPANGSGRLIVDSSSGPARVTIDGKPAGATPATVDLKAGSHRVLVSNEKGSVERSVKIQAGESSEMTEAIFSGWLAVTAPVELTLSEGRHVFDRDERGWALMAPGPHDIHLDNRNLGVHEVRHVLVKPGEPTWLSVVPRASE